MAIQTATYAEAYEELSSTIEWIESLGLDPNRGRISQYHRNLGHWKDNYLSANDEDVRNGFAEFINAIQDADDLVAVYRKFHTLPPSQLESIKEKLSKALNGPVRRQDEQPRTTIARNFLFEALVAARLHHPERGVMAMLDAKTDTGFKAGKNKVWVECKRITSFNKLEANIRDASEQLEKAFKRHPGSAHKGLVAIDISKLANDGSKILVKPDENTLRADMGRYVEHFIEQQRQQWEKVYKNRDKRIMGTLVRLSTMASVEEKNLPTVATEWVVNPRDRLPEADQNFLLQLASTLDSA